MFEHYRKKPVVISAVLLTTENGQEIVDYITEHGHAARVDVGKILIETLEGTMVARPGDWVVMGLENEFYPVAPSIFAASYEAVED